MSGDTIAAVATAPGRGAVAIVRISGEDSFEIASRVVSRPVSARDAGRFFHASFKSPSGETVDDGLVLAFASPRSYTGEDSVELQCHGGTVSPRRVLESCIAAGARLARRGEFTLRAFLNGRLSLDAAEAVIDLIDAETDRAAQSAHERLGGKSRRQIEGMYKAVIELSGRIENSLDFSEDELPGGFLDAAARDAASLLEKMESSAATLREGEILRRGALVVISGPPNAGKSSLLNALLGESRAIVSAKAGTTRDSIEERLDIGGWPVRLVDTAGLREAEDEIEAEGVRRSESLAAKADVVLALKACDGKALSQSRTPDGAAAGVKSISILSKSDLLEVRLRPPAPGAIFSSALTGEGIDGIKSAIAGALEKLASDGAEDNQADVPMREREAISKAAKAVREAAGHLAAQDPVLAANAFREAAAHLGGYLGRIWHEDVLSSIFDRFCVGK